MNESNLMSMLGLSWLDPAYIWILFFILFLVILILQLVMMSKFRKLKDRYEVFMEGKEGKSLEDQFEKLFSDIYDLKSGSRRDRRDLDELLKNIKICYQKKGLVKYDAFHEMGGKLSFALCMLDKDDNGFIMNSVHSNAGCYTYTKEIVDGKSAIELGVEEKEALDQAIASTELKDNQERIIKEASLMAEKSSRKKQEPK